jgi:tRNA(Arg) A34 adenosine deaminase TadA
VAYNCLASDVTVNFPDQLSQDEFFMAKALEQARLAVQQGNHPVGCVLVKDGRLVASAQNTVITDKTITHHAEMNIINKVCRDLNLKSLEGFTLYSSCEPCPMCTGAMIFTKISAVVYGASQKYVATLVPGHSAVGIREITNLFDKGPEVRGPVLKEENERLLLDYVTEFRRKHGRKHGLR